MTELGRRLIKAAKEGRAIARKIAAYKKIAPFDASRHFTFVPGRLTVKAGAAEAADADRLRDAFDHGSEHWTKHQDDDLATVHRYASAHYSTKEQALEFVGGFSAARRRHDEFLKEKSSPS